MHLRLRPLLGGAVGPAGVVEGGRRLAALLGLGAEHADDVVVAELALGSLPATSALVIDGQQPCAGSRTEARRGP